LPRWPKKPNPLDPPVPDSFDAGPGGQHTQFDPAEEAAARRAALEEDAKWKREERAEYLANAKRWVTSEGKKEFKKELIETLMVNLQIERDEGQDIKPELEMHARACRKQVIETGNLLLEILDAKD
jgi:hypothetical protein